MKSDISEFIDPSHARILDITNLPQELLNLNPELKNAVAGDGIDDTAAIQAALNFSPNGFRIVYVPNGEYIVSDTLTWPNPETVEGLSTGTGGRLVTLRGESREGAVLRLEDGTFTDDAPGAVIETGSRNAQNTGTTFSFFNEVRNLTIDTGDNSGASGIYTNTNNGGGVQDVLIIDGTADGSGNAGLSAGFVGNIGPQLIQDVEIRGFETGIVVASNEFGATLDRVTLVDQAETGIRNNFNTIMVTNLTSLQKNDIPIITSPGFAGLVNVIDSSFTYTGEGTAKAPAFLFNDNSSSRQFIREVTLEGYDTAIDFIDFRDDGAPDAVLGDFVEEWTSRPVFTLFDETLKRSLNLNVPDTPEIVLDLNLASWANVEDFGAIAGDGVDDTAAFQAAIDSGATTVYLPSRSLEPNDRGIANGGGNYDIAGELLIDGSVERVIGLRSQIGGDGSIVFADGDAPAVIWEGIALNPQIENRVSALDFRIETERDVVIASGSLPQAGLFVDENQTVFLEDIVGGPVLIEGGAVYATQLNNEFAGTKMVNDGGILVVEGLKTERFGTVVETINGGQTEILGALILSSQADIRDGVTPIFRVEDSDFSASFRENQNGSFSPYSIGVIETRDGVTLEHTGSPFYGTSETLFVSRGRLDDAGRSLLDGTEGADVIDVSDEMYGFAISGFAGEDVLRGGIADDVIDGGAGEDRLTGGAGNDTISGGSQYDTIFGGAGDDDVDGGNGRDYVDLGDGNDVYRDNGQIGVDAHDTVEGGEGADMILGGGGDDVFSGGEGDDVIEGGSGEDRLTGGAGNDTIFGGSQYDTIFGGAGDDDVDGGNGRDYVELGDGDDIYRDNGQTNAHGHDTVMGGAGADTIFGGGGDDVFSGGADDDVLTGGAGADEFVFAIGDGTDVITDFALGVDAIKIDGALLAPRNLAAASVTAAQDGADVVLSFGVNDTIRLEDHDLSDWSAPSVGPVGQAGSVTVLQSDADQWHRIAFDAAITDAIVVMGPVGGIGVDPAITRIRDVTENGFEFQIDEWDYLDGWHTTETVGWVAVSEGTHVLEGGQMIVAGTSQVGTNFASQSFGASLTDAIVLSEVTSVNDAAAVTTRTRAVSQDGFQIQIEEEGAADGAHVAETVSWIAIETGRGDGIEVVRTADTVTHAAEEFEFVSAFETAPVFIADMQTTDGADPAALRLDDLTATGVSLFVEEEKSLTAGIGHTTEIVGILAIEEGLF